MTLSDLVTHQFISPFTQDKRRESLRAYFSANEELVLKQRWKLGQNKPQELILFRWTLLKKSSWPVRRSSKVLLDGTLAIWS